MHVWQWRLGADRERSVQGGAEGHQAAASGGGVMRSGSSMSDIDTAGVQSALRSSSATTLTHLGDDSPATASGTSAANAGSADGDSGAATGTAAEAQAMLAHLALGLDSHDEQYILGGQVRPATAGPREHYGYLRLCVCKDGPVVAFGVASGTPSRVIRANACARMRVCNGDV